MPQPLSLPQANDGITPGLRVIHKTRGWKGVVAARDGNQISIEDDDQTLIALCQASVFYKYFQPDIEKPYITPNP